MSALQKAALTLLLALILWLPRGLALDRFVAVDERSWLTRSGNFYLALSRGDLVATFQRYHPGVTTMWLGMAGYLWRYPGYPAAAAQIDDMSAGVEGFLRDQGREPIDLLAAGRAFVVAATVLTLLLAFRIAVDLLGLLPALIGFLLIAFEPFLLGLTRMLHVDGLSSAFMLLAVLAFLRYCAGANANLRHGTRYLVISGVAAGLAWLSKSPALFLAPFMALVVLAALWQRWRASPRTGGRALLQPALAGLVWFALGAGVFVLLWPAMWVQPLQSLAAIFSAAGESAAEGHSKALFYNGHIYTGDPGFWFYPHTYLWRATPVTLLGLVAAIAAFFTARPPLDRRERRSAAMWLALFVLLFTLFMTFGSKKFPRYLLPVYMPLNLLAGMGWAALGLWVQRRWPRRWTLPAVLSVTILAQALLALPHFPYYFTYYNPLLGGAKRVPQVMTIGLGEGLDEAARYLAAKPGAADMTVASWYRGGSFNYLYPYASVDIDEFFHSDYAVLYAHQWQRQVPDKRLIDYFAGLTPEYVVRLHGTDYASIYNLHDAAPPAYFTDWADAIRLVRVDTPDEPVTPGEVFVVRLHFYSIAPLDRNLSVLVRLVDAAGNEVARSEGWPYGMPTADWQPGSVYVDGHEFVLPPNSRKAPGRGYVRVEVAFYDPATGQIITPTVAAGGTPLPDLLPVGYAAVAPLPGGPDAPFAPPALLGDQILLTGAAADGQSIPEPGALALTATPGASVPLTLHWRMRQYVAADYTVLLHLIGPDGALAAQWDGQPVHGLLPTTLWRTDGAIVDERVLDLPADLPPGEYRLVTGLYNLADLQRLPVSFDGKAMGDTVHLATLNIAPVP